MKVLLAIALLAPLPAMASTWLEEGSVVPMTEDLQRELETARLCQTETPEGEQVFDSGSTIFLVKDGSVEALKNMYAERIWLDYCQ